MNKGNFIKFTEEYLKVAKKIVLLQRCSGITCGNCPVSRNNSTLDVYCAGSHHHKVERAELFIKLYNEINKENGMKIEDLKTGMILKNRRGELAMVLRGVEGTDGKGTKDICGGTTWMPLENAKIHLPGGNKKKTGYDIMEIWQPEDNSQYLRYGELKTRGKCIWKREDVKEMTMSEVNAMAGCNVKIVEGN